ncbi:MAG: phosphate signaling complex protein PhoU [Rhodobacterales bacterium]|nr:phosphate signaling complex protein PhoU [Rhodobacterales bacterium]
MTHEHIVKKFDRNLEKIKVSVLEMGEIVIQQVEDATAVLVTFDSKEADRITMLDRWVNGLNKEIYDRAEILIVRRQPMALDLRQSLAPINISSELERIGDHAKSTAKRAEIINKGDPVQAALDLILEMSRLVQTMLRDVLVAYANLDVELAAEIRMRDREVDNLNKQMLEAAIALTRAMPENAEALIHLVLISRNFERAGDHVCNIARFVHQIATGEDLKASVT